MDGNYLARPLVFLVQVLFGSYELIVLLRFLLQLVRADFYNPVSQFIVKATTPVLRPMRRLIPGAMGLDLASLVFLWILKSVEVTLVVLILGAGFRPLSAVLWAIPELLALTIDFYTFGILILVLISWVSPGTYNPAIMLLDRIARPLLGRIQAVLPLMGGLDLSPMVALVGLQLLRMLLLPPLVFALGSPLH